jgi:hypothetical protein
VEVPQQRPGRVAVLLAWPRPGHRRKRQGIGDTARRVSELQYRRRRRTSVGRGKLVYHRTSFEGEQPLGGRIGDGAWQAVFLRCVRFVQS